MDKLLNYKILIKVINIFSNSYAVEDFFVYLSLDSVINSIQ
jgi:hypothetical protein